MKLYIQSQIKFFDFPEYWSSVNFKIKFKKAQMIFSEYINLINILYTINYENSNQQFISSIW